MIRINNLKTVLNPLILPGSITSSDVLTLADSCGWVLCSPFDSFSSLDENKVDESEVKPNSDAEGASIFIIGM